MGFGRRTSKGFAGLEGALFHGIEGMVAVLLAVEE